MRRLLAAILAVGAAPALGQDAHENLDFRLFLGRIDGNENRGTLADDSHRYSIGLGASSPVAWDGTLEANLEGWLTERGYRSTLSATSPAAAETMTFTAGSLCYGLRFHPRGTWRPYVLAALGLQTSRLSTSVTTSDGTPARVQEEMTTGVVQFGAGFEYRSGQDLFSLDWRRWNGAGDFSEFHLRDVDVGGEFIGISLGHAW